MSDDRYSKYSMDELSDLLWQIDEKREPQLYEEIFAEIERRLRDQEPKIVIRPWREWVFETPQAPRNFSTIRSWWESRRGFYNVFAFCVSTSSWVSAACMMGLSTLRGGTFQFVNEWLWLVPLLGAVWLFIILILQVFILLLANICFFLGWIIDGILSPFFRIFGWRTSVSLFIGLLIVTFAIAAIPVFLVLRDLAS